MCRGFLWEVPSQGRGGQRQKRGEEAPEATRGDAPRPASRRATHGDSIPCADACPQPRTGLWQPGRAKRRFSCLYCSCTLFAIGRSQPVLLGWHLAPEVTTPKPGAMDCGGCFIHLQKWPEGLGSPWSGCSATGRKAQSLWGRCLAGPRRRTQEETICWGSQGGSGQC